MKIAVKDVSGAKFELDGLELSSSVGQVKAAIQKAKGWETGLQKLVLSGKVLGDDSKTLSEIVRCLFAVDSLVFATDLKLGMERRLVLRVHGVQEARCSSWDDCPGLRAGRVNAGRGAVGAKASTSGGPSGPDQACRSTCCGCRHAQPGSACETSARGSGDSRIGCDEP
jgi:hypothetical protein